MVFVHQFWDHSETTFVMENNLLLLIKYQTIECGCPSRISAWSGVISDFHLRFIEYLNPYNLICR